MRDEQERNKNEWAQLAQGDYLQSPQQQGYVPEGYGPVQGYTPVQGEQGYASSDSQSEHSAYSDSNASSYGSSQTQEISDEEVHDFVSSRQQKRKSKTAMPKQAQPKSKRAERREKIAKEHQGEVSASDNIKGLVEWHDGVFKWWDSEDKKWLAAAYHDSYRDQFILEDMAEGTYVVAPERGIGYNDITTPCAAFNQLDWNLTDRDSWDNIVDADGNKVLYLLSRPPNQSYAPPERLWIHDDCVLLDGDNNPVRPWAGIPRCFSSKIEGGRIEALRRILPLTIQDIRARMVRAVQTGAGRGAGTKPLSYPSTFGHRSSRFRALYQCPAWLPRAASDVLRKQVIDQLPGAENATTTEGLRVLSRYEVERRKSSTRGMYLYKAAGRAISEEEREERDRKVAEKLARQAAREPKTPQPPQSMPVTPGQSLYLNLYLSPPPLSAGSKRRREDDDLEYFDGQSEPVAKRGRHGASPLDPRLQGRFHTSSTTSEDLLQQASDLHGVAGNDLYGRSGSSATGLGLDFEGEKFVNHRNTAPSQSTNALESPPSQPQASDMAGAVSTHGYHSDSSQMDYRFVHPQTLLQQLRIQAALFYTRAHCYALLGEHPPHTTVGSYQDQYDQIVAHLKLKWSLPDEVPYLADIGPWNGSFDIVPTPTLPDEVLWIILHPMVGAAPTMEASHVEHHAQAASADSGAEHAQTAVKSEQGPGHDRDADEWNEDLFEEYLGEADADEDLF